jgi:8-oxo-dGTP diphosphatase
MSLQSPSPLEASEKPKRKLCAGLVLNDQNQLLIVHNIKRGTRIEPPGGKVHEAEGETPREAVIRELEEELGLIVEPEAEPFHMHDTESPEGDFEVFMFLCTVVGGEVEHGREPQKIGKIEWLSFDAIRALEKDSSVVVVPNLVSVINELEEHLKGKS